MRTSKPILLVEDDSVDAMTVKRALKDLNITNQLIRTTNGEEALDYLNTESNGSPCVILLDLNMPKMNGIEFLKIIKVDEVLKEIPIVALTTSKEEGDVKETFKLGVADYIVKPVDYKKFVEALGPINQFCSFSELPIRG